MLFMNTDEGEGYDAFGEGEENDYIVVEDYTGDDTELLDIMVSHEQYMHNLTIAMMTAEHRAVVDNDMTIAHEAIKAFFARVWDKIKEFWAKLVAFFKSLWDKIVGLFVDREKWIKKNEAAIMAGAKTKSARFNLPDKFKKWNSGDEINKAKDRCNNAVGLGARVNKFFGNADHERRRDSGGKLNAFLNWFSSDVNKQLVGQNTETVNYVEYFNDKIGVVKEVILEPGIINVAIREASATKSAKESIKAITAIQKNALAAAKDFQKMGASTEEDQDGNSEAAAKVKAANAVAGKVASFTKALNNTVVKMCNYGWGACRKVVGAKAQREGFELFGESYENGEDGYDDGLSRFMP